MRLIFTDNKKVIIRYINENKYYSGDLFICLHWDIAMLLQENEINYVLMDDILQPEDSIYINEKANLINKSWYLFKGKNYFIHKGISLGSLLEYKNIDIFISKIKFIVAASSLINKYRLATIVNTYHSKSIDGKLLSKICIHSKRKIEYFNKIDDQNHPISPSIDLPDALYRLPQENAAVEKKCILLMELKKHFRESVIILCTYYSKICNFIFPNNKTPKVLFSCYRNENKVLKKWFSKEKRKFNICLDPYALPNASLLMRILFSNGTILSKIKNNKQSKSIHLKKIWKQKIDEEYKQIFKIRGICIFNELNSYLDNLVTKDFNRSIIEIDQLEKEIIKNNIKLAVVYDDVVQRQRTVVEVGNKLGVKTLLIQHGLKADINIKDKLTAKYLALTAEYDKEFSINQGTPKERIYVTGNPYFDEMVEEKSEFKKYRNNQITQPRFLVITHTEDRKCGYGQQCRPEKYITTVLDGINRLDLQSAVKIKLHPSESKDYYLDILQNEINLEIKITKDSSLAQLLHWSDIVILPNSTAVFEANIMGCFIIALNITKLKFVPPIDGSTEILTAKDSYSLFTAITSLIKKIKKDTKTNYSPRYDIKKYMGNIDGHSTQRVLNLIEKMC